MQNLFRNVSKRFVWTKFEVESVNNLRVRSVSTLSKTSTQINIHNTSWVQRSKRTLSPCLYLRCMYYSTEQNDTSAERKLPKLSDEPLEMGPGFFSIFKCIFKTTQIRQWDSEFSLDDFVTGSKKAVEVNFKLRIIFFYHFDSKYLYVLQMFGQQIVSEKLANGDLNGLRGLLTDELIDRLKPILDSTNEHQRSEFRTASEDICKLFVSNVETEEKNDRLSVKITMIYHVIKGFADLNQMSNEQIPPKEFFNKASG